MSSSSPHISLGCNAGGIYLAVNGPANSAVSAVADRLVAVYLAAGQPQPRIVVDLAGADFIDSTFAGWMLGLRKRLGKAGANAILLAGCSEPCHMSLKRMHLLSMFESCAAGRPAHTRDVECADCPDAGAESVKRMAAAHADLAAVDEENRRVFGPIADMLRKQIQ